MDYKKYKLPPNINDIIEYLNGDGASIEYINEEKQNSIACLPPTKKNILKRIVDDIYMDKLTEFDNLTIKRGKDLLINTKSKSNDYPNYKYIEYCKQLLITQKNLFRRLVDNAIKSSFHN
jgi:hypothetical protein